MATYDSGRGDIPRGIEVLVKKASVDPEFRALLLAQRAEAAKTIGLELTPAEALMVRSVPTAQLESIIAQTSVSPITRAAFLGQAAAAMLAALTAAPAATHAARVGGSAPDRGFVLYLETDYKGDAKCGVLPLIPFRMKLTNLAMTNQAAVKAFALAQEAWQKTAEYQGVPFPMEPPKPAECKQLGMYQDAESAEKARSEKQEELAKQAEEAQKKEAERVAGLTPEARAEAEKLAALRKAAEQLFEQKLREVMAAGAPPPVSRGVSPDRPPAPPAPTGIRPDYPVSKGAQPDRP